MKSERSRLERTQFCPRFCLIGIGSKGSFLSPALGVCRKNRISPCKLRDLRVFVLKLLRKNAPRRHGEHGEGFFRQTPVAGLFVFNMSREPSLEKAGLFSFVG